MTRHEERMETREEAEARERGKSPRRSMCSSVLGFEAIVLGLTTPVMIKISSVPTGTALWIGLGLTVVCLVLCGSLRRSWAYYAGWVVQVAAVALGFVIPLMFVLGGIFALLWGMADGLGRRIDAERAAAFAAWDQVHPGE